MTFVSSRRCDAGIETMILKLKQTPAIYLVGFMGCGKSTAGGKLADKLGWRFYELDAEIEKAASMTISEIFDRQGELKFREMETAALKKLVNSVKTGRPQVIALGGGTFTIQENYELAANGGVTIWLDAPFDVLEARIAKETNRPLARDPVWLRHLYESRREDYARADYHIVTGDETPDAVVARIMALPLFIP